MSYQGNISYALGGTTALSSGQEYQQFKYTDKEYDPMHGLNQYDFGARNYDPAIGRFTSVDPLAEKYYHLTPYSYCGGDPVNKVDPDGRYIVWIDNNNTEWRYNYENNTFMNQNGDSYNGDNLFVGNLTEILKKLREKEAGRDLVRELAYSNSGIIIAEGKKRSYEREYVNTHSLHDNIKSVILLCVNQEVDGFQQDFTTLAHEMAHAQDRINGTMDNKIWYKAGETEVYNSEIYATHIENIIRAEHGIALRWLYSDSQKYPLYDINSYLSNYFTGKYTHLEGYKPLKRGMPRYKYK